MSEIQPYLDKYSSSKAPKIQYPNPWFDLSSAYMPKDIKTLFKYCRTFFYKNGFLNSVITKLSEYPITEILYDNKITPKVKDMYKYAFNHVIHLKSLLMQTGLDYFVYGNAFISVNMKFERYLLCPSCGTEHAYDKVNFRWRNYEFHGNCPKCNSTVIFKIKDQYLNNPEFLKFVRWSPENIDLDYDDLSGTTTYYYKIPALTRKKIQTGNKKMLKTTPELFIKALKEKKKVELDPTNVYHFKRPTLAEDNMGWGKPIMLASLSDIWYMQTLKRGNEAIAAEHVVPFRALYPSSQGTIDPFTSMNMAQWKGKLQSSLEAWKQDPNHIAIFPIPIGSQNIGGDSKMLSVTPELKYLEESIINSLGIPVEFIKGGASWSGSSVSLRIVENHFINYRNLLEDFVNFFVIKKVHSFLKYPETTIHFKKLRMADDTESKRVTMELGESGKLSTPKVLDELGYDFEEEKESRKETAEFETEVQVSAAIAQAEAQGKAMEIQAKYQVRAERAMISEKAKMRELIFKDELSKENSKSEEVDVSIIIEKYAEEMMLMDPETQLKAVKKLQEKFPYTAAMVIQRIQEKNTMDIVQGVDVSEEPKSSKKSKPKKKDVGEKKAQGKSNDG